MEKLNDLRTFPRETERKDIVFDALETICNALGCYLNDHKFSITREFEEDREFCVIRSVYGTFKQSITNDSVGALLGDCLKVMLPHIKEMDGIKEIIDEAYAPDEE